MNLEREIVSNASGTHSLARRYYWMTSCVGLLGVGVGIVVMLLTGQTFAAILGISENAALGTQPNSTLWLVSFLVCIPISIYLGCVIVASIFATTMVWLGKLSVSEAIHYALLSRYPASWRGRYIVPKPALNPVRSALVMQMKDSKRVCGTKKAVCIGGLGNRHGGWWIVESITSNPGVHTEIFDIEIYFDGTGYLLCYATAGNLFYGDSWHSTELEAKMSAQEDLGVNLGDWTYA